MNLAHLWIEILRGLLSLSIGSAVLIALGTGLVLLGVLSRRFTFILVPLGVGLILANFGAYSPSSVLGFLYSWGIATNLLPLLAALGLGALVDLRPVLARPRVALASLPVIAAVLVMLVIAGALGFPLKTAAASSLAGSLNIPALLFTTNALNPETAQPAGLAVLLFPLILAWAAARLPGGSSPEAESGDLRSQTAIRPVDLATQSVFSLFILLLVGLFFSPGLPLTAAFLVGTFLHAAGSWRDAPAHWPAQLAGAGLALIAFCLGSSLAAGAVFAPAPLQLIGVALAGLVVQLGGFWLLARAGWMRPLQAADGPDSIQQAAPALAVIFLSGTVLSGILITIASALP